MKERENMPKISAAAIRSLSNDPSSVVKIIAKEKKTTRTTGSCVVCFKNYPIEKTNNILERLPTIKDFDTSNMCLSCIKEECKNAKKGRLPELAEVKKDLAKLKAAYYTLYHEHNTLAEKYHEFDYMDEMISHHLVVKKPWKPEGNAKKSTTPRKTKTDAQKKKDLILKMLSKLPEDQRDLLLKTMTK